MSDILESLLRVAEREGIDTALHFGSKAEHMALHLDRGAMVEHREKCPIRIPWPVNRTGIKPKPNLLFDSAKYLIVEGDHRNASGALHKLWASRFVLQHAAVDAVMKFFGEPPPILEIPKKQSKLDLIFYFKGKPICEIDEFRDAIDHVLRSNHTFVDRPGRFDEDPQCVLDTHGKISFVGLDNPQALLGFNQNVTWSGSTKATRMLQTGMSYASMRLHIGGLEWLRIHRSLRVPSTSGGKLHYLAWTDQPHRLEPILSTILRGWPKDTTSEEWRTWIVEHLDRDKDLFTDTTRFNALSLLCGARIAIRGFHVMTVAQLAQRLLAYLTDFSFCNQASGSMIRAVASPYQVLKQVVPGDNFPLSVVERFFDAIFLGSAYPRELLPAALNRYADRISEGESSVMAEATINAFRNRPRDGRVIWREIPESPQMRNTMDVHHSTSSHPFFLAGRIFGVMETRNYAAKDRADQCSITRQFKRAWANPGKVFPHLLELSEAHARKLETRKHRAYRLKISDLFTEMLAALSSRTPPTWPGRASSEDKMIFAHGREYQRQIERGEMLQRQADYEASQSQVDSP